MAVRDINSAKPSQKKEPLKISVVRILIVAVFVLVVAVGIGQSVVERAVAKDYNEKTAEVSSEASSVSQQSSEIYEILNDEEKLNAYYEKVAREDYGYAKPGEKVFYISSYGE